MESSRRQEEAFFVAAVIGLVVSGGERWFLREQSRRSVVSDWLESLAVAVLRAREGGRRLPPGLARVWENKVS